MNPNEYNIKKARFWALLKAYVENKGNADKNTQTNDISHTVSKAPRKPTWPKPPTNQYKAVPDYTRIPKPTATSAVYNPARRYPRPRGPPPGHPRSPSRYNPAGVGINSRNFNNERYRPSGIPWHPSLSSTTLDPYERWLKSDGVYLTQTPPNTTTVPHRDLNSHTTPHTPTFIDVYSPSTSRPIPTQPPSKNTFVHNSSFSTNNSTFFNSTICEMSILEDSKLIYLYGIAFLVALALLLNGVSFGVFNTKALRRFAFSSYLAALALADTLALLSQIPRLWMTLFYEALGWDETLTIYDDSEIACKALTYISYVFRFLSAWITIALLVERSYVAAEPFRKSNFSKQNTAYKFTLYILVLAMVVNCHVIFTWTTVDMGDGLKTCSPKLPSDSISYLVTVITVIIIIGLPFVITSILTVILIRGVNSRAWRIRPLRMTPAAIFRLELERRASLMVSMVTAASSLLSVPYVLTWGVLLAQPWFHLGSMCERLAAIAARDVTEVIFMASYTIKFLLCILGGNNILNLK